MYRVLPAFGDCWRHNQRIKPRILILEIRHRDNPNNNAIAWIFVEREETYTRSSSDNSIIEASIRLSYQRIVSKYSGLDPDSGEFGGRFLQCDNSVSLTRGAIFLDLTGLKGCRIGTYLMNEIVQWAQQWPDASVNPIELKKGQGCSENKKRRNWFYEQFGIVFDYVDPENREGISRPMLVNELMIVKTWEKNIKEHETMNYLSDVLFAKEHAELELYACKRNLKDTNLEMYNARSRPIRWAVEILYSRYKYMAIIGSMFALLILEFCRQKF